MSQPYTHCILFLYAHLLGFITIWSVSMLHASRLASAHQPSSIKDKSLSDCQSYVGNPESYLKYFFYFIITCVNPDKGSAGYNFPPPLLLYIIIYCVVSNLRECK